MNKDQMGLWLQTAQFHGHECPGLAIGFRMALQAQQLLGIDKSSLDEEIVCITENDACGVDAVQFILSCTFGKGNLIYQPRGKMAMSFYDRNTGKSCRFVLKSLAHMQMSRSEKQAYILTADFDSIFDTKNTQALLPKRASIYKSVACAICQEDTAEPMLHLKDGQAVCQQCDGVLLHNLLT